MRDALPMPPQARWLVIWEDDKQIYEEKIPDPPKLRIVSADRRDDGILLTWESEPRDGLCYVVHWKDIRHGAWRGVAPRLEEKYLLIPKSLLATGAELQVRVYATSGIATAYADTTLKNGGRPDDVPGPQLTLLTGAAAKERAPSSVMSVAAFDSAGRQVAGDYVSWYDGAGNLLARGAQLDVRSLLIGQHVVRAVVSRHGDRVIGKSWLIERTVDGWRLHHVICDPPPHRTHEEHQHPHPAPPPCEG
jgi:hypothetical protein